MNDLFVWIQTVVRGGWQISLEWYPENYVGHWCMAATSMQMLQICYSLHSSTLTLVHASLFCAFTLFRQCQSPVKLFYMSRLLIPRLPFFYLDQIRWLKLLMCCCMAQATQTTFGEVLSSCNRTAWMTWVALHKLDSTQAPIIILKHTFVHK